MPVTASIPAARAASPLLRASPSPTLTLVQRTRLQHAEHEKQKREELRPRVAAEHGHDLGSGSASGSARSSASFARRTAVARAGRRRRRRRVHAPQHMRRDRTHVRRRGARALERCHVISEYRSLLRRCAERPGALLLRLGVIIRRRRGVHFTRNQCSSFVQVSGRSRQALSSSFAGLALLLAASARHMMMKGGVCLFQSSTGFCVAGSRLPGR